MYEINIVTGGSGDAASIFSENDICALARMSETRARIEPMLNTGTPLRN
jgi:hypothetical protein